MGTLKGKGCRETLNQVVVRFPSGEGRQRTCWRCTTVWLEGLPLCARRLYKLSPLTQEPHSLLLVQDYIPGAFASWSTFVFSNTTGLNVFVCTLLFSDSMNLLSIPCTQKEAWLQSSSLPVGCITATPYPNEDVHQRPIGLTTSLLQPKVPPPTG